MLSKKNELFIEEVIDTYTDIIKKKIEEVAERPAIFALDVNDSMVASIKCYKCGFEGKVAATTTEVCPRCGAKLENVGQKATYYNYVAETADGFIVIKASGTAHYDMDDYDLVCEIDSIVRFDGTNMDSFVNAGADIWAKKRANDGNYYWYNDGSGYYCNLTEDEKRHLKARFPVIFDKLGNPYYRSAKADTFSQRGLAMKVYDAYKEAVKNGEIKKTTKKKEEKIPEITFPHMKPEIIEAKFPDATSIEVTQKGLIRVCKCKCCGYEFPSDGSYMGPKECPNCHKPNRSEKVSGYVVRSDVDEDSNILISMFDFEVGSNFRDGAYKYKLRHIKPKAAIYANEDGIYFYTVKGGKPEKSTCNDINSYFQSFNTRYYSSNHNFLYESADKFVTDIERSVLGSIGYVEFCKYRIVENLTEYTPTDEAQLTLAYNLLGSVNYLNIYNNCKAVEQLAKSKMTQFMEDLTRKVSCPKYIRKKETTPNKILGLSKAQFKEVRDANISQANFETYLEILKLDPMASYADCVRFMNRYNMPESVLNILGLNIPKINMKEVEKYAASLDDYQCMDWMEGMRLWYDYLKMCIELKCDMNDRSVIFTNSLKLEHDRAVRKYNNIKNKKAVENFEEAVKRYQYLEYQDDDHDFMIIAPKTQEELYEEGRVLHHCVGSYAKSVAEGRSTILFIRSKSMPDRPLCTVEVARGRLVQARTKYNAPAYSVPGVKKFMQAWAKEKGINLSTL